MKAVVVLIVAALVAVASANDRSACTDGGSCNGNGRSVESLARSVSARYTAPIQFPCRFDCMQLTVAATGSSLFSTCQNSIISYSGDYFGVTQNPGFNINYQCLTPSTYTNYFTSRAKLAKVIDICQDNAHRCRRSLNRQFDTTAGSNNAYAGLPALQTLSLTTTAKYYQWYSQFESMRVVNNVVRCPTSYNTARSGRNGRNKCNCDLVNYPELFSAATPKMPTQTSDNYRTASNIPNPVNPVSSYVQGFLGNYQSVSTPPTIDGDRAALLLQARLVLPSISRPVHLGCIDDDVDITSECDD